MTAERSAARLDDRVTPRLGDLLAAEWIKLRSLRSNRWVLGLGAVAAVGFNINGALADYSDLATATAAQRAGFDPLNAAFGNSACLVVMLVAASVGALSVVGEYGSGLIRTTFTAVPARRWVLAAKIITVGTATLGLGTVVTTVSFWSTQAILAAQHSGYSITQPGAFRAAAASALLAPVCALVGIGAGAVIRHIAGTIVATVTVLELLPQLFTSHEYRWVVDARNSMPHMAWERLITPGHASPELPTIAGSWTVYLLWPLISATIALVIVGYRDL
jgi:ABC-2 type transport system permease protein